MFYEDNENKESNEAIINGLIANGCVDRGWANGGKSFSSDDIKAEEELDCSLYRCRGTHIVYVSHTAKELLRVDMSD